MCNVINNNAAKIMYLNGITAKNLFMMTFINFRTSDDTEL
jgi:hypothetical protein